MRNVFVGCTGCFVIFLYLHLAAASLSKGMNAWSSSTGLYVTMQGTAHSKAPCCVDQTRLSPGVCRCLNGVHLLLSNFSNVLAACDSANFSRFRWGLTSLDLRDVGDLESKVSEELVGTYELSYWSNLNWATAVAFLEWWARPIFAELEIKFRICQGSTCLQSFYNIIYIVQVSKMMRMQLQFCRSNCTLKV